MHQIIKIWECEKMNQLKTDSRGQSNTFSKLKNIATTYGTHFEANNWNISYHTKITLR